MKLDGYSNYEIDVEQGTVYSYKSNRYIGSIHPNGYCYVDMTNDSGEVVRWRIHRLIWTVVNGEIPEGMEVNHIDEIKTNNSIANLNLMTHQENCNWGTRNERMAKNVSVSMLNNKKKSKPIIAFQDGIIKLYFPSTQEAHRNGFDSSTICQSVKNKTVRYGYVWEYMDNYLADWWDRECIN